MNAIVVGILKTSDVFTAPEGGGPARGTVWGRFGLHFGALWCHDTDRKPQKEAVWEGVPKNYTPNYLRIPAAKKRGPGRVQES